MSQLKIQKDFRERIARLSDSNQPKYSPYIQPGGGLVPLGLSGEGFERSGTGLLARIAYPLSFVGACVLGVFAVFLSRYVGVHFWGAVQGDAMHVFTIDAVRAASMGGLIAIWLKLTSKEHVVSLGIGLIVALTMMHNLVWLAPQPFIETMGFEWVSQVRSMTAPETIWFGGGVLRF